MEKEEDKNLEAEYAVKCFKTKYITPELENLGIQVTQITMNASRKNISLEKFLPSSEPNTFVIPIDTQINSLITIADIEPEILDYFHSELTSALRKVIQKTIYYNSYRIGIFTENFKIAEEAKNKFEKTFGEPLVNKTNSKKGRKSAKPSRDKLIKLIDSYNEQLLFLQNLAKTYKELYNKTKGTSAQRRKEASNILADIYIKQNKPLLSDVINWVTLNRRAIADTALKLTARLCGIEEGLRTLKKWKKEGEQLAKEQPNWLVKQKALTKAIIYNNLNY